MQRGESPSSRLGVSYQVAEFGLRVSTDEPELLDHANSLLEGFRVEQSDCQAWSLVMRYGALKDDSMPSGTRHLWSGLVPPGLPAVNYAGPEFRRLELTGFGRVEMDLRRRDATIVIGSRSQAKTSRYFLTSLLCTGLARSQHFPIHAACLAVPAGEGLSGVLIVAPSGTGKSTTSFALTSAGWKLMGDDLSLLCRNEERLAVWGFPRVCHVRRPTLDLLPWLRSLPLVSTGIADTYGLSMVDLGERGFGIRSRPLDPAMVLVLDPPNATGHRFQPLDPVTALASICHENVQPIEGGSDVDAQGTFEALAALVRQTPVYRLSVGPRLNDLGAFLAAEVGVAA